MRKPYDDVRPFDPSYEDLIDVNEFEFEWNTGIWSGGNVEGKGFIPSIKDEASGGFLDDEVGGSGGFLGYGHNTNRGNKKNLNPYLSQIIYCLNSTIQSVRLLKGMDSC